MALLSLCIVRYDAEATFFDEGVRVAKRKQLEEKLLQVMLAQNTNIFSIYTWMPQAKMLGPFTILQISKAVSHLSPRIV